MFIIRTAIVFIIVSIKAVLRSLSCASAMVPFSEPAVVGLLDFRGDTLS